MTFKRTLCALAGAMMIAALGTGAVADVQAPTAATQVSATGHTGFHGTDIEIGPLGLMPPEVLAAVPATGKAILVNIPSFELIAFEDRRVVMRSRVIIGTPRTQTPIMLTETSVVRFRPTWTPTPRMVKEGICPGTRRGGGVTPWVI